MSQTDWRIAADLHTHTSYSDGRGTVEDNARAALQKGLSGVAITDHGPNSPGFGVKNSKWEQIRADCENAAVALGVAVFFGCEANVISLDGSLDVPLEQRAKMDIVAAGLHPIVYPKTLSDGFKLGLGNLFGSRISRKIAAKVRNYNTKALVEAVHKNRIDIVTHPGLGVSVDTDELARACAARNTALEINETYPLAALEFIQLAKKRGASFAIGSDAHFAARVGDVRAAERLARRAGLGAEDLVNAVEVPTDLSAKHEPDSKVEIEHVLSKLRKGSARA